MQINQDLQSAILSAIKRNIEHEASLADELAECLSVSKDSAYRRIRGETLFDISDIEKLTRQFNLSLDSFFGLKKSNVSFGVQSINLTDFTFFDYLNSIEEKLAIINKISPRHLYYSARDIPIFHYFQIPELGKFKLFFWLKYYIQDPALQDKNYSAELIDDGLEKYSMKPNNLWNLYLKVPSTEIWTYETANITLRQIEFSYQAGIIDKDKAELLLTKYKDLLNHIHYMAQNGNKCTIDSHATLEGAEYKIYFNEVAIGDNSILFKMGDRKMSFITYSNINYMTSTDEDFTDYQDAHFQSTIKTSTLISVTSEKTRSKIFNSLIRKIELVESNMFNHSPIY